MWKGVAPLLAHHAATGTSCCGPECEIVFKRECVYLNTFKCIYTYIYMYARCTFIFTHYMYLYVMRVYINICGIYMQYINIYIYICIHISTWWFISVRMPWMPLSCGIQASPASPKHMQPWVDYLHHSCRRDMPMFVWCRVCDDFLEISGVFHW